MKFYNCLIKNFQSRHKIIDKSLISVIQKILDIGLIPAIKIKQTLRVKIKHPLIQLSKEKSKFSV